MNSSVPGVVLGSGLATLQERTTPTGVVSAPRTTAKLLALWAEPVTVRTSPEMVLRIVPPSPLADRRRAEMRLAVLRKYEAGREAFSGFPR